MVACSEPKSTGLHSFPCYVYLGVGWLVGFPCTPALPQGNPDETAHSIQLVYIVLSGWKKTKLWKFCNRKTCLWGSDIHVHNFKRDGKPGLYLQMEDPKSGNDLGWFYSVLVYSDYLLCLHLKWENFSYLPEYEKRCAVSSNAPTHMLAELGKTLQQIWFLESPLAQRLRFILYNCRSLNKPTTFRALFPLASHAVSEESASPAWPV